MVLDHTRFPVNIQTIPHIFPGGQIYFPRVTGLNNHYAQEAMNQAIVRQVQQLMAEQKQTQTQGNTQMSGYYELKTNERAVLSLTQANYAYTPPMAHVNVSCLY
jgi:hypothetical protein